MKKYISLLLIAVLCFTATFAQTDSRNRVASTIIADGLAQLPAKNLKTFNQVIGEMASTGEEGVCMIAGNLKPAGKDIKNSVFEYALSGITDYAASKDGEKCRAGVRSGLIKAIEKCSDATNKTFLLNQLRRVANAEDFALFAKYLNDEKLSIPALAAIETLPGVDNEALNVVKTATKVPHYSLAKIVEARKLKGAEDQLVSWVKGADNKTLIAVYDAMAAVGSEKSLKVLESAAKSTSFAPETTHALDAYIKILDRSDNNTVAKAAKALVKAQNSATRCAGLRLLLKSSGNKAAKEVVNALKDKNIEYRNTALLNAAEYAGKDIYSTVASAYGKLATPAKTDVVKWLGNNHATAQEAVMVNAVASTDSALSCAGMEALAKIGTPKALETLVAQLDKKNGSYASKQLLAFNGDITSGILNVLKNGKDAASLVPALKIAGQRHIHSAYNEVEKLTGSSDANVSAAAYDAIAGVAASASNYSGNIAALLEKSSGSATEKLQKALCNSLVAQNASEQYSAAANYIKNSKHPEYYYTLLAQSGTSEALTDLQKALTNSATSESAIKAMLLVNNPEVIPVLLSVAKQYPAYKEQTISRYITLVDKNISNKVKKYQHLLNALDCNPAEKTVTRLISDLGSIHELQPLAVVADKMNNATYSYNAAYAAKTIVSHNDELNAGDEVVKLLNKAKEIALEKKNSGNADAGYAVDEITETLGKHKDGNGFTINANLKDFAQGEKLSFAKNQENIAYVLDWKTDGEATVVLRSLPVARLSAKGLEIIGTKKTYSVNPEGEFNTLKVNLVDDRLFIESNGEKIATNAVFKEIAGTEKSTISGNMEIVSSKGTTTLRNYNANLLPATPVYTLSDEEKKAGFELLFDGHSLDKWQGNTTGYTPDKGTIYVTAHYGGSGNLYTKKKYSDFVYRFEFCFETPGVNNGVGIRTNIGSDAAYDGMEIQILDHDDPIYAGLQPYQQHGSVYGICVPKHVKFGKLGTWNTQEIRAVGDRIIVTVNGEVVTDCNIREACQGHNVAPNGEKKNPYTVDHKNHPGLFNKDGYVSFCGHGPGVRFRNIRILDLSKNKKTTTRRK